jgi:SNF2 family DNA or RNA helicase
VKWGLPVPNISTYASAHKWLDKNIDVLICDESLLISNPDAKRTKSTQQLAKNTPVVLAMTGTPLSVAKNPLQARWINVIREGVVPPTKTAFQYSYGERLGYETIPGAGIEVLTVYEWDFDRLTRDFKPYCEVVDEREILKQVPEITFERIHLPRPKHFDMVLSGGATTLTTQKRLSQALAITDGFIYSDDKLPIRFDSVKAETALELYNNIGEPVVIVANWRESIEICVDVFEAAGHKPAVIDGKRDSEIELARFLNGETDIIILSAAKTLGMNLQERASVMVFLSLSSQPSMYQQALGRIHRPGQKKGCVVYHLLCESTLDERRLDLITEHTEASSKFIESLLAQELRGLVK